MPEDRVARRATISVDKQRMGRAEGAYKMSYRMGLTTGYYLHRMFSCVTIAIEKGPATTVPAPTKLCF